MMGESAIEKEIAAKLEMGRLFENLDEALLRKGKLVLTMRDSYQQPHIFDRGGSGTQTLSIYEFENGLSIARENYLEIREERVRSTGFPRERSYDSQSTHYFVYKGGVPVTDEEEVKALIQHATGVKLPQLAIPRAEIGFGYEFEGYRCVWTKFEGLGKMPEEIDFSFLDKHPSDRDIAIELGDLIKRIDSLKEEFVVESAADGLKEYREVAAALFARYEKELRSYDRLGRKSFHVLGFPKPSE